MSVNNCRRCLLLESAENDAFKKVEEGIKKISPGEKTESNVYAERLNTCRQCESLVSGTCLKCGCYVEFRAAFRKKNCPCRKW